MTLIEVLFAVVILSGVMLALSRFGQEFTRATRNASTLGIASDLAAARLEVIRAYPAYDSLETVFAGTESEADADPPLAGYAWYTRTTSFRTNVVVVSGDTVAEFKTATVTVSSALLKAPVAKSADIAARP